MGNALLHLTVTQRGQVPIPAAVRRRLAIRPGDRVEVRVLGDSIQLRFARPADAAAQGHGFGRAKSKRASVPADFDVAQLLAIRPSL
jgi:antitoxin PrlF